MTTKEHILWTLERKFPSDDAHYLVCRGEVDGVDVAMSMCVPDVGESRFAFYYGGVEYSTEADLIAAVRARKDTGLLP